MPKAKVRIEDELKILMNTGKVILGAKRTLHMLKLGKLKMVIIARNCPSPYYEDLIETCEIAKVPYIIYEGSGKALGVACKRPHVISAMGILTLDHLGSICSLRRKKKRGRVLSKCL